MRMECIRNYVIKTLPVVVWKAMSCMVIFGGFDVFITVVVVVASAVVVVVVLVLVVVVLVADDVVGDVEIEFVTSEVSRLSSVISGFIVSSTTISSFSDTKFGFSSKSEKFRLSHFENSGKKLENFY